MTNSKVKQAETKAKAGNVIIEEASKSAKKKFNNAIVLLLTGFLILFILGVASYVRINQSITKQNQIATDNKKHIDCVVKLFTTPLPPNARSRTISDPSSTCSINFSQ